MKTSWLIVAGGAHGRGGQDRANLELVGYLSRNVLGEVHLVTHEVDPSLLSMQGVHVSVVPRPLGSIALGERLLEHDARRTRSTLGSRAIVVANGGNYPRADVNWVHSVHHVWPVRDEGAPVARRLFNRLKKWDARRREAAAITSARLIIANSSRTAHDLVTALGVARERIATIQFGADGPTVHQQRTRREGVRLAFVGALGWDRNKGLDRALEALALLMKRGDERTTLVVAGPGSVTPWLRLARDLGVDRRVTFLGMVQDVPALLRDVDLLVSPVRYEAYGLAVQEALVAGVPALVSANAGITSILGPVLPQLIVPDEADAQAWAAAIERSARDLGTLKTTVALLGASLRKRSWEEMAAEIVNEVRARRLDGR